MLKWELKKLLFKQYALPIIAMLIIGEMIFFNSIYSSKEFNNEAAKENYYTYMEITEGKLDSEKESYLLSEQDRILLAQSQLTALQNRLYSGKLKDKNEYLSEFTAIQEELEKSEAFDLIISQYRYAKKSPEQRYISSWGDIGMCRDFPDVMFVVFVVGLSALFFLNEESTQMITLIRACESKKRNTFIAKAAALLLTISFAHISVSAAEFGFLYFYVGDAALHYPIQSLEYFGGCEYSLTILQTFVLIQLIKMTGYVFISALTMLICVVSKKPMISAGAPLAICILQQFIFPEKDWGYYLPTGLLRGVGYFRGDAYEAKIFFSNVVNEKVFSAVHKEVLLAVILSAIIFAIISIMVGLGYYKGSMKKRNVKVKGIFVLMAVVILCSACSKETSEVSQNKEVYFNLQLSGEFGQYSDYYFQNTFENGGNELYAINKYDNTAFEVMRNPFKRDFWVNNFCIAQHDLYAFQKLGARGFTIYKIDLDTYDYEIIANQNDEGRFMFLGLKHDSDVIIDKTILSTFTNGTDMFFVTSDTEVYMSDMKLNWAECIISDGIYKQNLIYTGSKIYYINNRLELVEYDIEKGEVTILVDELVMSFELAEGDLIYSLQDGIYSYNLNRMVTEKIADESAEKILSDGDKIVFYGNGKLYCLNDDTARVINEGQLISFGVIKGTDTVICTGYSNEIQGAEYFCVGI